MLEYTDTSIYNININVNIVHSIIIQCVPKNQ